MLTMLVGSSTPRWGWRCEAKSDTPRKHVPRISPIMAFVIDAIDSTDYPRAVGAQRRSPSMMRPSSLRSA
jgi:hypothetical protein